MKRAYRILKHKEMTKSEQHMTLIKNKNLVI